MFCHNCGYEIDEKAIYCERCGVKVREEESDKTFNESDPLTRYYDLEYELEDINEKIASLPSKKAYLSKLNEVEKNKNNQLMQIQQMMFKEKKDYEDLLKFSFASIKARLSGDLDERKRKEEAEYLEALANFKDIQQEEQKLKTEIDNLQGEIAKIQNLKNKIPNIEQEMEKMLAQLTAGKTTEKLKRLDVQYEQLQIKLRRSREIENQFKEADTLLEQAEGYITISLEKLRKAQGLGTWDTFFRGGFFIDAIKHGDLDSARSDINQAQALIRRAKDLVDVIDEIYIDFEAPNLFVDIFFDNFFFDLFGNAKIRRTRENVELALDNLYKSRKMLNQYLSKWVQNRKDLEIQHNNLRKLIREERASLL